MDKTTRRDVMKFFGIGTIIAPVAAAAGSEPAPAARLIQVPKVEIIKPEDIQPLDLRDVRSMTVTFERFDGTHATLQSESMFVFSNLQHGLGQGAPQRIRPFGLVQLRTDVVRPRKSSSPDLYDRIAEIVADCRLA